MYSTDVWFHCKIIYAHHSNDSTATSSILVKAFSSESPSKILSCILHCVAVLSQYEEQQYRCHCYPSTVNLVNVSILHTSLPVK